MIKDEYEVWRYIDNYKLLLKSYPFKIQAITYCWIKGFVYQGHGWYFLDKSIEIKKKKIQ